MRKSSNGMTREGYDLERWMGGNSVLSKNCYVEFLKMPRVCVWGKETEERKECSARKMSFPPFHVENVSFTYENHTCQD